MIGWLVRDENTGRVVFLNMSWIGLFWRCLIILEYYLSATLRLPCCIFFNIFLMMLDQPSPVDGDLRNNVFSSSNALTQIQFCRGNRRPTSPCLENVERPGRI